MFNKNIFKIEYGFAGLLVSFLVYLLALLGVFSPFIDFARSVSGGIQEEMYKWGLDINTGIGAFGKVNDLYLETDNLRNENIELLSRLAELQNQIDILEKQLAQQNKISNKEMVPANIRYMSEIMSEIILGAGSASGVVKGDVVVIGNVPVGEVTEVGATYCRVKTILSDDIRIPIKFSESGMIGFLSYSDSKGFTIANLPSEYNFKKNELVITTGVNSPYFYGLLIGNAEMLLGNSTDPSKTVQIHYPININEVQTVFIILNSHFEIQQN